MSNPNEFPSGQDMAEEAARAAEVARGQARTTRSSVRRAASDQVGATPMNERINQALGATGRQLNSLAQELRARAPQGQPGAMASSAAEVLDRGAGYLQGADAESLRGDLERLIRANPLQALVIGVGVGFLLGRTLKR